MNLPPVVGDGSVERIAPKERLGGAELSQLRLAGCAACDGLDPSSASQPNVAPSYIYALGRIQPRVGSAGLEKEIARGQQNFFDLRILADFLPHGRDDEFVMFLWFGGAIFNVLALE